ncbi:MAG: radical SAM protein [Methanobrevibacter sp.]|jgi:radical SAM protein with 4Fe4S-binding SPASM domain|nr:radical SAM protein [Candidatus Methanovirga procula]
MLDKYPYLKEGYYVHQGSNTNFIRYSSKLVKDRDDDPLNLTVSKDIVKIIKEFDGVTNLRDVVKKLVYKYDEDYDEVLKGIKGLIDSYNCFRVKDTPVDVDTLFIGGEDYQYPFAIDIELTDFCNFDCKHCYNDSHRENREFIDVDALINSFNGFDKKGVSSITLTGGEPLSHPDIGKIVEFCCEKFNNVGMITNGSLLNKHIYTLKSYSNLSLQVTLNSSTPKFHDWFCGVDGQFEIVKDNIKNGVENGLNITVLMIVTPYNIDEIYSVARLAKDLGVSSFRIGKVLLNGRATDDLIYDNVSDLLERRKKIADKFEDGFVLKETEHAYEEVNRVNCGVGSSQITVSPTGNIGLCQIQVDGISFGNILNENPDDIFNNLSGCAYHNLQEPVKELCGDCKFFNDCRFCVVIGLQHYFELGDECRWGSNPETQKYIKTLL